MENEKLKMEGYPCQRLKDERLRHGDPSFGFASSGRLSTARDDKFECGVQSAE